MKLNPIGLFNAFTSVQGAGTDSAVQGDSQAGWLSAGGPTFLSINKNGRRSTVPTPCVPWRVIEGDAGEAGVVLP
jgi:hypothetical protein